MVYGGRNFGSINECYACSSAYRVALGKVLKVLFHDNPAAIIERHFGGASDCAGVSIEHRIGIIICFDGAFELVLNREGKRLSMSASLR
jgi:hypothetical protein